MTILFACEIQYIFRQVRGKILERDKKKRNFKIITNASEEKR